MGIMAVIQTMIREAWMDAIAQASVKDDPQLAVDMTVGTLDGMMKRGENPSAFLYEIAYTVSRAEVLAAAYAVTRGYQCGHSREVLRQALYASDRNLAIYLDR